MTHILVKLTIPLIILMTIPILLIHGIPHDDSELLTFLSPPDHCPVPCFMGIQAGVTRVSAGQSYLQANPHIQSIKAISLQLYEVDFNDTAPAQSARIYFMALPDVTIERVNLFDTGLPFNRFFLAFGTPQRIVVYKTMRPNTVSLVAFYPHNGLSIVTNFWLCAMQQSTIWSDQRDVSVEVGFWRADSEQPDYYLVATELNIESWAKQLRDMRQERCP